MEKRNQSADIEFLLLGFSDLPEYRPFLTALFLTLYLLSLMGNLFIISAVNLEPQLHTPMYFFLGHLSFVDLCLTSVTVPKLLDNLISMSREISFLGCFTQMYLFVWLVTTESFLLAVMAYDRYVAICNPLHYRMVMSAKLCILLVMMSWGLNALHAVLHTGMTLRLCFRGINVIHSFFCDIPPLLELSCSDTSTNHLVILIEGSAVASFPFLFIMGTYIRIITSIVKLHSAQTWHKALLTCSSHFTVVVLFYATVGFMYFQPSSKSSQKNNRVVSVMYALATPMLNSFIYSLRNKEMKGALKKGLKHMKIMFLVAPQ
ncbi:olfactory receptor-like protein DTMT [Ambystoma mexicanum]|uniref:olfactory receptor-like protein DTMT n=1 Tax=Ambystoma mexicanum TaxID=8296 RepID=UPI0037E7414B